MSKVINDMEFPNDFPDEACREYQRWLNYCYFIIPPFSCHLLSGWMSGWEHQQNRIDSLETKVELSKPLYSRRQLELQLQEAREVIEFYVQDVMLKNTNKRHPLFGTNARQYLTKYPKDPES